MLTGLESCRTGHDMLRRRIATNTISASKYGEWTQGMEGIAQTAQRFPTERQLGLYDGGKPVLESVEVRVYALPTDTRIRSCQGFDCRVEAFETFLGIILPALLQLQDQIVDLLLQVFDQPMRLAQRPARGERVERGA